MTETHAASVVCRWLLYPFCNCNSNLKKLNKILTRKQCKLTTDRQHQLTFGAMETGKNEDGIVVAGVKQQRKQLPAETRKNEDEIFVADVKQR